jgi:hypothetical protein
VRKQHPGKQDTYGYIAQHGWQHFKGKFASTNPVALLHVSHTPAVACQTVLSWRRCSTSTCTKTTQLSFFTFLQSAKVILSELNGVSEAKIMRHVAPLALLFMVLAQVLGLMWTIAGVWPDVYSQ